MIYINYIAQIEFSYDGGKKSIGVVNQVCMCNNTVKIGGYRPRTFRTQEMAEKTIEKIKKLLHKNGYVIVDQKDKENTVMSFMNIDNVIVKNSNIKMSVMEGL